MKKASFVFVFMLLSFIGFTQEVEGRIPNKYINALQPCNGDITNGDLMCVKYAIEQLCNDEDLSDNPLVWYSSSYVYARIGSENPNIDPDWLDKAAFSLQKWEECRKFNPEYDIVFEEEVDMIKYIYTTIFYEGYFSQIMDNFTNVDFFRNRDLSDDIKVMQSCLSIFSSAGEKAAAAEVCWMIAETWEKIGIVALTSSKYSEYKEDWFKYTDNYFKKIDKYLKGRDVADWWHKRFGGKNCNEMYKIRGNYYCDSIQKAIDENDFKQAKYKTIIAEKYCQASGDKVLISRFENLSLKINRNSVDSYIPESSSIDNNTYAFIIANENYPNRNVPYALNDGRIFKEYCNKTLGIPINHIKIYENATAGQITACVASVRKASEANDGDLNVIFYYAGHAFPDENTKDAYLMPIDGDSRLVSTCYSLNRLYKELAIAGAKSVVCFLDACFSGATREDDMLLTGRGVAIKPKEETPQGNLIVFTSASGNETAHQYEEKQHGLFTYYLLKKMQDSKGTFTLGEMYDYVSKNVKKTSYDVNNKIQTPSVIPSETMGTKWRNIKL